MRHAEASRNTALTSNKFVVLGREKEYAFLLLKAGAQAATALPMGCRQGQLRRSKELTSQTDIMRLSLSQFVQDRFSPVLASGQPATQHADSSDTCCLG